MLQAFLELESDPAVVAAARAFTNAVLARWSLESLRDDAVLIASELVANAVLHAGTPLTLALKVDARQVVRIELHDQNPRLPSYAPPPLDATSGRGLTLVAALSSAWGVEAASGGKVVWAETGAAATGKRSSG